MLFDTHSHLNFPQFEADLPLVLQRAKEAGVSEVLVVGTDMAGNQKALQVARDYQVWAAVSFHPHEAESKEVDLEKIKEFIRDQRVVAVGETGLDYACPADKEKQALLFRSLLKTAEESALPVIVHSRDAAEETLMLVYKDAKNWAIALNAGGVALS